MNSTWHRRIREESDYIRTYMARTGRHPRFRARSVVVRIVAWFCGKQMPRFDEE